MTTERDQVVNDRSRSVAPTFQNALSEAVDSHHLSEPLIGWIKSISECPDHPCLDSSGFSITFTFQAISCSVEMYIYRPFFSCTEFSETSFNGKASSISRLLVNSYLRILLERKFVIEVFWITSLLVQIEQRVVTADPIPSFLAESRSLKGVTKIVFKPL